MGHDERSAWDLAQWREYARQRDAAYLDAMTGWGQTVQELERHAALVERLLHDNQQQRRLLEAFQGVVTLLMSTTRGRDRPKKGVGRPAKSAEDDRMLAAAFASMKTEYMAANPGAEGGDNAVLTWYFERVFQQGGVRGSRARSKEFQAKLKTIRNRLGDYRNKLYRRNPEN